jgi:hypothetical protein
MHHGQGAQQTRNLVIFEDFIEILSLSIFTHKQGSKLQYSNFRQLTFTE